MIASPLFLLGIGIVVISVWMLLTYCLSRVIENSGIIDVAWAFGFTLVVGIYSALAGPITDRRFLLLVMVSVWSLRLTAHLFARFLRWYPDEDARYKELKSQMGVNADEKMLLIFLWQGAILVLLSAPMAVSVCNPERTLSVWQYLAVSLWFVALVGEATADAQLEDFSRKPQNKGKTCQEGLWRYSRHPNYFFEWLVSVSFFLFALDSQFGFVTVVAPAVLLHLIINVTGVKPAEEHSLRTRSDYAEYKRVTSAFVPWFRRAF